MTRRGYHCRVQPSSAHGKPAVIGRQNRLRAPGQFAARKWYRRNVSPKSGTTSSNSVFVQRRGERTSMRAPGVERGKVWSLRL